MDISRSAVLAAPPGLCRARHEGQERREREQPADAADAAAFPRQRVRPPTESMSPALQWFAQYQLFTPFIETFRAFVTRDTDGRERIALPRLVPRDRHWWLAVGAISVRAPVTGIEVP